MSAHTTEVQPIAITQAKSTDNGKLPRTRPETDATIDLTDKCEAIATPIHHEYFTDEIILVPARPRVHRIFVTADSNLGATIVSGTRAGGGRWWVSRRRNGPAASILSQIPAIPQRQFAKSPPGLSKVSRRMGQEVGSIVHYNGIIGRPAASPRRNRAERPGKPRPTSATLNRW